MSVKIPYVKSDGKKKEARVIPVEFSLDGLTDEEVQVIGHLSKASDSITPVFAKQSYDRSLELFKGLLDLERTTQESGVRSALDQYNTLYAARYSPWAAADGLGLRFPLSREDVPKGHSLGEFSELLIHGTQASAGKSFYPVGITEEEIDSLEDPLRVNSSIVRTRNGLKVVLHEDRYKEDLIGTVISLEKAKNETRNQGLKDYIDAKIVELKTGTLKSREDSYRAWLALKGPVDFVIGTGIEQYMDKIRGVRGNAQAVVCRVNEKYQGFCDTFLGMLPELEEKSPWENKKKIETSNIPQLRFVDVATWAGGYERFPFATRAESLPNEEDFRNTYGSVNLVFANIQESLAKDGEDAPIKEEFMPHAEVVRYGDQTGYMHLMLTAAHELGHASGGVAIKKDPTEHFGREYSRMEEARAELFALWSLPFLVERGIITPDQEMAGYYAMALTILPALKRVPNDHTGSRNMMFHYFMEKGAFVEVEEDGKLKYGVNAEKIRNASRDMLGIFGDIRATGDKERLEKFKGQYLSESRKTEFERRFEKMPEGLLFIFPSILQENGKYTRDMVYPSTFRGQTRTLNNFVY